MEQSLDYKTISPETVLSSKEAVSIVGRALGNLIYRFYSGNVQKVDGSWDDRDRKSVQGTKNYILGGSIGTNGYTKHLLPLLATKQFNKRCENEHSRIVDINILISDINSANAGAIGATLAFKNGGIDLTKSIWKLRETNKKIPIILLIDIGGTKINIITTQFTDENTVSYNILKASVFPTPKNLKPDPFYDLLASNIISVLSIYKESVFNILPFIAVGQPGLFESPQGGIKAGAQDLGSDFIGCNPSKLLKKYLKKKGYPQFDIYVCNDGRAQFFGLIKSISCCHPDIWRKMCGNNIIYLGIGTGLGAGYGTINSNGSFDLLRLKNAYDIIADDKNWESIEHLTLDQFSKIYKLPMPYQYGDIISSKFFRKFMQTVDLNSLKMEETAFQFLPLILSSNDQLNKKTIREMLESEKPSSPYNSILINQILEKKIFTSKTEEIIEIKRKQYEKRLMQTLDDLEKELRNRMVANIRKTKCEEIDVKKCDYNSVIDMICKVKKMGKCVHFIGIGKSYSIGRNLEYIYNNLGIRSSSLELTGANSENLTHLDQGDLVFMITNSGETYELLNIIKYIQKKDCTIVALTGNLNSPLARHSKYAIDASVESKTYLIPEAPTTSTTAALAAGTAIAMVVSYHFDYDKEIFFIDHPDLEFEFDDFEGVKADPSFDKLAKIEDIFTTFADSLRKLKNKQFINNMFIVSKKILVSHFNMRTIFLTGAGASLRVVEKIAATMTSIGIDAVAVNPAQLPHGDFAHLRKGDLLIIISYKGETKQLARIASIASSKQVEIAVITSKGKSTLAKQPGHITVIAGKDADDSKLVPIPDQKILSSFINLTVGDALAVMLAEIIDTTRSQFAKESHPGGEIERQSGQYDIEYLKELKSKDVIKAVCNVFNPHFDENDYCQIREHLLRIIKIHTKILKSRKKINHLNWLKKELFSRQIRETSGGTNEVGLIGMGSIGLAYLGRILTECGKNIIFIESNEKKVEELRSSNCSYQLQPCGETCKTETQSVKGVMVYHNSEIEHIAALALRIDIIFIAIGIGEDNLNSLIPTIAYITMRRYSYRIYDPLNIVFNENFPLIKDPLADLRHKVLVCIKDPYIKSYFNEYVGLVPAIDEAVIPNIKNLKQPIKVEAEFPPIYIDSSKWKHSEKKESMLSLSDSPHINFSENFFPLHMRKLWIHNMTHALIGYLGHVHKHVRIYDALRDKRVKNLIYKAIHDIATEVYRRWNYEDYKTKEEYIKWRIKQYKNSNLNDTVKRVCREPDRKLEKYDRLVGPLNYIWKYRDPNHEKFSAILVGIVAAMHYAVDKGKYKSYNAARKEIEKNINVDSKYINEAEREFEKFCK
ncbi:SIS domain-containing protein [bacterium]